MSLISTQKKKCYDLLQVVHPVSVGIVDIKAAEHTLFEIKEGVVGQRGKWKKTRLTM